MGYTVLKTEVFNAWFIRLKDKPGQARIQARIDRMEGGNLGDWKAVDGAVSEARLDFGPGYRLYFTRRGLEIVILLCGGDKSSQRRDVTKAIELAEGLKP